MRRLPAFVLVLFALLGVAPSAAHARCGVPQAKAEYETPEVQVYVRGTRLIACHRATNRGWAVGVRSNDGMGTDEFDAVNAILGGRWIWSSYLATFAESSDVREDSLTDLRTGRAVKATVQDETTDAQAVAVRGALVVVGAAGVVARFTDGRRQTLSTDPSATALAASGSRVYWTAGGAAHSTVLTLPPADPAARRPVARTIGRCKPRRGARLVYRDEAIVVTRAGRATWACRRGKTRRVADGPVQEVAVVSDRVVAYARNGAVGTVDVANGRWRELPSRGGPLAAGAFAFAAAGDAGVRSWTSHRDVSVQLGTGAAFDVALGEDGENEVAYWTDGGGTPQVAVIPR